MMLAIRESPFSNGCVDALHTVSWTLILPCFWSINMLLAMWLPTGQEKHEECYLQPLKAIFGTIFFVLLFIITAVIAFFAFLVWAPLQAVRRPYCYHGSDAAVPGEAQRNAGTFSFSFVTANVCLLPEGLARFNNLGNTHQRATRIGQLIVDDAGRLHGNAANCKPSDGLLAPEAPAEAACNNNSVSLGSVSPVFPADVALLCMDEVFDKQAAWRLTQVLSPVFGHILYDVGVYACQPPCYCSSFKFLNSGLFLASRYPVLEARYHLFNNGGGEDALAAKGLLCVKVLVGENPKKQKLVGYFSCSHLQAPEADGELRCEQLTMITQWITQFQDQSKQPDDVVLFDVLCGDFNFDNCSPDDSQEQNHAVFDHYKDPCRDGPGKEKPWAVGTLLQQPKLYEDDVSTPEKLQRVLQTEDVRKDYLAPPLTARSGPFPYPDVGSPWIGRRIDYMLYREHSLNTEVEGVTYVSRLATLADHIPVALRLNVSLNSD